MFYYSATRIMNCSELGDCTCCNHHDQNVSRRPWHVPMRNPKRRFSSGRKLSPLRRRARDAYRLGRRGLQRRTDRFNPMRGVPVSARYE